MSEDDIKDYHDDLVGNNDGNEPDNDDGDDVDALDVSESAGESVCDESEEPRLRETPPSCRFNSQRDSVYCMSKK